jgi:hypothetical protein
MIRQENIFFMHYWDDTAELMEFNDWGDIIWWIRIEGIHNYKLN